MTAPVRTVLSKRRLAVSVPTTRERRFVLHLLPTAAGDSWGFTLAETIGKSSRPVARVNPAKAVGYRRAVVDA